MARLLLIRHAPTPETGTKLTGRISGVSLGEAGEAIARRTSERLANIKIKAIYASPIDRTWETAQIVAEPHRLSPIREDGLLEVDYGDWSGRTLKSLYKLKAWRVVMTTPSRMVFPGGEGLADAQARAVATCERLAAAHRKETIALVTHSDIIRSTLSHYVAQPLDLFDRIAIAPASVSVLDLPTPGMPRVLAMNGTGVEGSWR